MVKQMREILVARYSGGVGGYCISIMEGGSKLAVVPLSRIFLFAFVDMLRSCIVNTTIYIEAFNYWF